MISLTVVNKDNLTELEIKLLNASRVSDYEDAYYEPTWLFDVVSKSGLTEKVARGVMSSLVKKGLASISDWEGHGKYSDSVFLLTDVGKMVFETDGDL